MPKNTSANLCESINDITNCFTNYFKEGEKLNISRAKRAFSIK